MASEGGLYDRWSRQVRTAGLFRPGERVGVAVSGGPDSVLLLEFMKHLAREVGLSLLVVHFNHHLRGEESDADERFVRELAQNFGLEFMVGEAQVAQVARERRQNLEATARELRYRWFFSLVNQGRLDRIATAHTANDQAETVLLRLLRGAGTRGLGGIYPVLEGKIVRPFLSLTREEMERELRARNLNFRTDSTNLDPRLQRNKIRMQLLPLLQKDFSPEVVMLLKELADRARDDEAYLEQQARDHARPWLVREGVREKIPLRALLGFSPAIRRRVLRQMILAACGSLRRGTYAHIEALRRFAAEAQSGRRLLLPAGLVATKEFDWLVIAPHSEPTKEAEFACAVQIPGEVVVPQLDVALQFEIVDVQDVAEAYNGPEEARLDASRLSGKLVLRSWRAGDRFRPWKSRKARKLKEWFRQRRIPSGQRKAWPVLEDSEGIVWVRGFAPAERVAISPDSRKILVITERNTPAR